MTKYDLFQSLQSWIAHTAEHEVLPQGSLDVEQTVVLDQKGVSQSHKPLSQNKPVFESAHQQFENQRRLKILEQSWAKWMGEIIQTTPVLDHENFRPEIVVHIRKAYRILNVEDIKIKFGDTDLQWRRGQMARHHTQRIDLLNFTKAIDATLAPLQTLEPATHLYGFGTPWSSKAVKRLASGHDPKSAAIVYTHFKIPKQTLRDNRPEQRDMLKMTVFRIENST
mgnify:CR=1 FL=1